LQMNKTIHCSRITIIKTIKQVHANSSCDKIIIILMHNPMYKKLSL